MEHQLINKNLVNEKSVQEDAFFCISIQKLINAGYVRCVLPINLPCNHPNNF